MCKWLAGTEGKKRSTCSQISGWGLRVHRLQSLPPGLKFFLHLMQSFGRRPATEGLQGSTDRFLDISGNKPFKSGRELEEFPLGRQHPRINHRKWGTHFFPVHLWDEQGCGIRLGCLDPTGQYGHQTHLAHEPSHCGRQGMQLRPHAAPLKIMGKCRKPAEAFVESAIGAAYPSGNVVLGQVRQMWLCQRQQRSNDKPFSPSTLFPFSDQGLLVLPSMTVLIAPPQLCPPTLDGQLYPCKVTPTYSSQQQAVCTSY